MLDIYSVSNMLDIYSVSNMLRRICVEYLWYIRSSSNLNKQNIKQNQRSDNGKVKATSTMLYNNIQTSMDTYLYC